LENAPIIVEVREHKDNIGDAEKKINDLLLFVRGTKAKKEQYDTIDALKSKCDADLDLLNDLLDNLPDQIEKLLATLQEMKIGSDPDEKADYFKNKKQIDFNMKNLIEIRDKLISDEEFQKKED